jgi:hypothetical protein
MVRLLFTQGVDGTTECSARQRSRSASRRKPTGERYREASFRGAQRPRKRACGLRSATAARANGSRWNARAGRASLARRVTCSSPWCGGPCVGLSPTLPLGVGAFARRRKPLMPATAPEHARTFHAVRRASNARWPSRSDRDQPATVSRERRAAAKADTASAFSSSRHAAPQPPGRNELQAAYRAAKDSCEFTGCDGTRVVR